MPRPFHFNLEEIHFHLEEIRFHLEEIRFHLEEIHFLFGEIRFLFGEIHFLIKKLTSEATLRPSFKHSLAVEIPAKLKESTILHQKRIFTLEVVSCSDKSVSSGGL